MAVDGTVVITGAGVGLGQALAVSWAARGAHVLALIYAEDHRAGLEEAVKGLPGTVDAQVLDVSAPGDFVFPDDTEVLINNAGIRLANMPVESIGMDEWRLYMNINFLGAVDMSRRAIPVMRARGKGIIVNMNSGSLTAPFPFLGPYRAAKGAMAAFSESLRVELASFGIRVVEFLPGAMRTGLSSTSMTTTRAQAADVPGYGALADGVASAFQEMAGTQPIPAQDAADEMVRVLLEDPDTFRHGTDAGSAAMIEQWRTGGGQPMVDGFIARLGVTLPA